MDKLPPEVWEFYIYPNMSRVSLLMVSGTSRRIRAIVRTAVELSIEKDYLTRVNKREMIIDIRGYDPAPALAKVVRESLPLAVLLTTEFTDYMSLQISTQFVRSVDRELTSSLLAYFPPSLLRAWWSTAPHAAFDGFLWNLKSAAGKQLRQGMAQKQCMPPVHFRGAALSDMAALELTPAAWDFVAADCSTATPYLISAIKKEDACMLFTCMAALSGDADILHYLAGQLETLPEGLGSWPEQVVHCAIMGSDATAAFVASNLRWTPEIITRVFETDNRDFWDRTVGILQKNCRHIEAILLPVFFELWRRDCVDLPPSGLPTKLVRWLDDRGFLNEHSIETILRPLMEFHVPPNRGRRETHCNCFSHVLYRHLISEPFNFSLARLGSGTAEVVAKRNRILKNAGYLDQEVVHPEHRHMEARMRLRLRREEAGILDAEEEELQ